MSRFYQTLRNETGLSDAEIRKLGESINIRDISNDGEVERVLAEFRRTNVAGDPGLYGRLRDNTGLSNDEIKKLALSLNIRDLDKEGEYTKVFNAWNDRQETQPTPDRDPDPEPQPSGVSQSDYDALLSDYNTLQSTYGANINAAVNTAIGGYEDRIRGMRSDFDRQLETYRGEMEANTKRFEERYQGAMDEQNRLRDSYEERLKTQETDFLDQLDQRNREEADAQLASVRAGSTQASTAVQQGPASLTSGQTSASRADKGSVLDIRPKVDATDSVLDRSGPVVQLIDRVNQRRPSGGGRSPLAGGSGANYYASRFG